MTLLLKAETVREGLNDPYHLVSAADCLLMTFERVNKAMRLWIRGRKFTIARFLGDVYTSSASRHRNTLPLPLTTLAYFFYSNYNGRYVLHRYGYGSTNINDL